MESLAHPVPACWPSVPLFPPAARLPLLPLPGAGGRAAWAPPGLSLLGGHRPAPSIQVPEGPASGVGPCYSPAGGTHDQSQVTGKTTRSKFLFQSWPEDMLFAVFREEGERHFSERETSIRGLLTGMEPAALACPCPDTQPSAFGARTRSHHGATRPGHTRARSNVLNATPSLHARPRPPGQMGRSREAAQGGPTQGACRRHH